jgi:hypothetical protein
VLSIIVVAFLQSMSIERQTARSYMNKYRAELAAESAANEATDLLLQSDSNCLVNAYAENAAQYNGQSYTAPYLTTLKLDTDATGIAETHYLCSSIDPTKTGSGFWRSPADASSAADVETTDINAVTPTFREGFIGLQDARGNRRTVPVPWREVLANPSKPKQTDRNAANYNPVVARYAYWIDDESAKINLSTAGAVDSTTPNKEHLRKAGKDPKEVALHTLLSDFPSSTGESVEKFLSDRAIEPINKASPMFPPSTFRNLSTELQSDLFWQTRRAFVTSWSESDERGPVGGVPNTFGVRKINLNDFVAKAHDYQTSDGRSKIAKAVVALGDYINAILPDFGKRAAQSGVDASAKRRYCAQIAANIQDYIDEDSQPTVIRQNLDSPQWEEAPDPNAEGEGRPSQPPAAFGKENVPSITEYVGYYYNESGSLRIDHTFEALNIYTKDIVLNPSNWGNVYIFLAQRPTITPTGGGTPPDLRDPLVLTIPANTVFPSGRYSLITTLPSTSPHRFQWIATDSATAKWTPINWITVPRNETTFSYGNNGLTMQGDGTRVAADADTEIVIANNYGYLDIQPRIAQESNRADGIIPLPSNATRYIATQPFGNDGASSTTANAFRKYPLDSGDPRSQTDIYPSYNEASGSVAITAWRRNSYGSRGPTALGGDSNGGSYGFMPDNTGDTATYVPEPLFAQNSTTSTRAMAVIRDGSMATIGELGFIYDPALPGLPNPEGTWRRGGFRTLCIGTRYGEVADAGTGGTTNDPLRLTQTVPNPKSTGSNLTTMRAYRLMDIFDVSKNLNGRILINSALRDPRNLPLKSVFYNLKTQSNTATTVTATGDYAGPFDPKISANQSVAVDKVISALEAEADSGKTGPFLSLGQIGDLDIFNTGTDLYGSDLKPNSGNTRFYDRGREEILRNTFQLLTLKGSVYTIYVVAQAGDTVKSKFVPKSTIYLTRTIKLTRKYPADPLSSITATDLKTNNTPVTDKTTVMQISNEVY